MAEKLKQQKNVRRANDFNMTLEDVEEEMKELNTEGGGVVVSNDKTAALNSAVAIYRRYREQFPECLAKIAWYARLQDRTAVAVLGGANFELADELQGVVASEGVKKPGCPRPQTFSFAHALAHTHDMLSKNPDFAKDLQSANIAFVVQLFEDRFPECMAKIEWYCNEEGVGDSCRTWDTRTMDQMQMRVFNEGAYVLGCPAVKQFSFGQSTQQWVDTIYKETEEEASKLMPEFQGKVNTLFSDFGSLGGEYPPMLLIAIPTMPREDSWSHYLTNLLDKLADQLDDLPAAKLAKIKVLVMNVRPKSQGFERYDEFEALQRSSKYDGLGFIFLDSPFAPPLHESAASRKGRWDNGLGHGHDDTQQLLDQTFNFLSLTMTAHTMGYSYLMLLDDDVEPCPDAVKSTLMYISDANLVKENWSGLHLSHGTNGMIIRHEDFPNLASFLLMNRLPVACMRCVAPLDMLILQWMGFRDGNEYHMDLLIRDDYLGDRRPFSHSSNIFRHIGAGGSTFSGHMDVQDQYHYQCDDSLQYGMRSSKFLMANNIDLDSPLLKKRQSAKLETFPKERSAGGDSKQWAAGDGF